MFPYEAQKIIRVRVRVRVRVRIRIQLAIYAIHDTVTDFLK